MSSPVALPLVVLRSENYHRMAWANGGGTTHQVVTHPPESGLAEFEWRVSLADIDRSGPFSVFPGIDRILMVIDGPGMALDIDGQVTELLPLKPIAFPGEAQTTSDLIAGPTRDLNVMTRRGLCSATVTLLSLAADVELTPTGSSVTIALVVDGWVRVDRPTSTMLDVRDAVLIDRPLTMVGVGTLARIEIRSAESVQDERE